MVWLTSSLDREGLFPKKEITTLLKRSNYPVKEVETLQGHGLGLVFFTEICAEGCLQIKEHLARSDCEVIVVTSQTRLTSQQCWPLLKAGVTEVLNLGQVERVLVPLIQHRGERRRFLDEVLASPIVHKNLVGVSSLWRRTLRRAVEISCFSNNSLLVSGESGTGKELIARLVHSLDQRKDKGEMVILDCTTVSPELSGSEFFGHEKGAFTNAVTQRQGVFALAHKGTLFLDEVGELPLGLQAELLRVTQEGTYKAVGGNRWQTTDFRLLCATNRNLEQEIVSGSFRADFFYRIATATIHLPPLAKRREDISLLVQHFLNQLRPAEKIDIDPLLLEFLCLRDYPGNVRELRQLICNLVMSYPGGGPLTLGLLPENIRQQDNDIFMTSPYSLDQHIRCSLARGATLRDLIQDMEDATIRLVFRQEDGHVGRITDALQVSDRTLQNKAAYRKCRDLYKAGQDGGQPPREDNLQVGL